VILYVSIDYEAYSPKCLESRRFRKSAYSIVHRTPPQSRQARSLMHPRLMTDSYMLWCRIDMRDHECSTATVDLNQTTRVYCVALRSPVSGIATLHYHPRRGRQVSHPLVHDAFSAEVSSQS
jgi:hypothetical protein